VQVQLLNETMTKIKFKVNPTSSEYQINSQYLPDKEKTWPFPPEKDGWVVAHNALRGEMQMINEALQAIQKRGQQLQAWEIKALNRALDAHLIHINAHHSNEDDIFTPELKKRFRYPDKLTSDHARLVNMLGSIEKNFHWLKPGDKVDAFLTEWVQYQEYMIPHLAEEEEIGLPLFRAYFTPKDAKPLIMKIVKHSPKEETGSLIYFCGVESWRNEFMVREKIPGFVWYVDFQFKHRSFKKVFVDNLESINANKERKSALSWLFWWNRV
jgi:hemerythrin-like domain-containing protein